MLFYAIVIVDLVLRCAGFENSEMIAIRLSNREVHTRYGQMRGLLVEFRGHGLKEVDAYLGIQYATTFTSQMRFMPPTSSPEKWRQMRAMYPHKPACPQQLMTTWMSKKALPQTEMIRLTQLANYSMIQNEECLYMNLYVPAGRLGVVEWRV